MIAIQSFSFTDLTHAKISCREPYHTIGHATDKQFMPPTSEDAKYLLFGANGSVSSGIGNYLKYFSGEHNINYLFKALLFSLFL